MKPVDPVQENMNLLMGKPVKAFMEQDHEAHLAVHMAAMQDPKMGEIIGQNPAAQQIQAAASAHIMEHVAFQYRREIEKQLGAALPPLPQDGDDVKPLPPAMAAQLAQLTAQAAAKLLQKDQAEAKLQQAAQQQQDPLFQLQMQELQLKQAEVERKKQKDQIDGLMKAYQLSLQEEAQDTKAEIDGARMGVEIKRAETQATMQETQARQRLAVDLFREMSSLAGQDKDDETEPQPKE
jgi:hypothetical protein